MEANQQMKWYEHWDEFNKKISERITYLLSGESNEILCYGINILINGMEKLIILLSVFYFLGYLKAFMISAIIMCVLRIWMGGTHRKSLLGCLVQSGFILGTVVVLQNIIDIGYIGVFIVMIFIIIFDMICCPVISKRRGEYRRGKIIRFKIMSAISILMINCSIILFPQLKNIVVVCEILEILDVCLAYFISVSLELQRGDWLT